MPDPHAGPSILDFEARERFRSTARRMSLDPENPWIGGYVDYEWHHGRHVLECSGARISGARVLEFGCNLGATSIVLTTLGAAVTAVDVNPRYVELARLNAACYSLDQRIEFLHVPDTTRLPFVDDQFDLITCNSVLEYVPHAVVGAVQRELDRVLKPGGAIVIEGTSNRLCPWERHSRQWFVNYLPRFVDRFVARTFERGISPWQVRFGFGPGYSDAAMSDRGAAYFESRKRMGMSGPRMMVLRTLTRMLAPLHISVGLLTPTISVLLRKDRDFSSPPALPHDPTAIRARGQ